MLGSKHRERARRTIAKHLVGFLKQEKGCKREDEPRKFYFLEEEGNKCLKRGIDFEANNIAWVSEIAKHKLKEIGRRVLQPHDETVTL